MLISMMLRKEISQTSMNNIELASSSLPQILYEDNHLLVVNKRSSDIVQGDKTGDTTLPDILKNYLKEKYQKPGNVFCGVVHRLDRPTSGVLLFARTSKALERLNQQFQNRTTKKIYWAIVEERPPKESDVLEHYLKKNEKQNKSYAYISQVPQAKRAVLRYELKASSKNYYLLEITLETGRHHQIRAQLAQEGMHIKGDLKYGAKRSNENGSISLHARSLEFIHPTKNEPIHIVAPVPEDSLWEYFEQHLTG